MNVLFGMLAALTVAAASLAGAQTIQTMPAPGAAQLSGPVTAEETRRTAIGLAQLLEDSYVHPETAKRYATQLRTRASAGAYDSLRSPDDLAAALTRDVQSIAPDKHLRVISGAGLTPGVPRLRTVGEEGGPANTPAQTPGGLATPGGMPVLPGMPAAIEGAAWIATGIAYVRLNYFPSDPAVTEAARRFMSDHATAKTIIFDVRTLIGGGLAQTDAMFPYLFSQETVLALMESRASVARQLAAFEADFSLREVPGPHDIVRREHFVKPHPTERRLFGAEVIVLTSPLTASAGEAFALSLKTTGRATLIGETTAGAGNYGAPRPISERFSAFVPIGSIIDPRTGQRWEGDGIEPDVKVPAEQALTEALIRSGVSQKKAQEIAARTGPQGPFIPPRRR